MRFIPLFAVLIGSCCASDYICTYKGFGGDSLGKAKDTSGLGWKQCPRANIAPHGCCIRKKQPGDPIRTHDVFYACRASKRCDPKHGNECAIHEFDGTADCACGPEGSCD